MPSLSATFFEIVIYIVPGFVVLYNFRHLSPSLENMFQTIVTANNPSLLLSLIILAVAVGVVVSGMASLLVPFVARLFTPKPKSALRTAELDFGKLYNQSEQAVQMFMHHMQIYRAYAHMSVALLLSSIAFFWETAEGRHFDQWYFELFILLLFTLSMFWASIRYFRHVFHIAESISKVKDKTLPL